MTVVYKQLGRMVSLTARSSALLTDARNTRQAFCTASSTVLLHGSKNAHQAPQVLHVIKDANRHNGGVQEYAVKQQCDLCHPAVGDSKMTPRPSNIF